MKRRLKRRNARFWRFKQRFKRRNASGFGVFDIYAILHCPRCWVYRCVSDICSPSFCAQLFRAVLSGRWEWRSLSLPAPFVCRIVSLLCVRRFCFSSSYSLFFLSTPVRCGVRRPAERRDAAVHRQVGARRPQRAPVPRVPGLPRLAAALRRPRRGPPVWSSGKEGIDFQ